MKLWKLVNLHPPKTEPAHKKPYPLPDFFLLTPPFTDKSWKSLYSPLTSGGGGGHYVESIKCNKVLM